MDAGVSADPAGQRTSFRLCLAPHGHQGRENTVWPAAVRFRQWQRRLTVSITITASIWPGWDMLPSVPMPEALASGGIWLFQKDEENAFMRGTCFSSGPYGRAPWNDCGRNEYLGSDAPDRLSGREGEWNTEHLGCVGFSGGGLQTLYLAALDERVRYAVISGYLYGFKDSLLELNGNCSCNYVPGLWNALDMGRYCVPHCLTTCDPVRQGRSLKRPKGHCQC